MIAAGFVGVVAAGLIAPPLLLRGISAGREVTPVASAGDRIPIYVSVSNGSRGRRGPMAGIDMLLERKTFLIDRLGPRETSNLSLPSTAIRRGAYRQAELRLETAAPFGIAKASRVLQLESAIIVHPNWVPLATFPLLESASTPNEALHERPRRGSGTDFYGLREYRPGDSLRRVHWRSSARSSALLVKEYEEHIGSRMSILIDGSVLGREPDTTFEAAVSCAASLVMYALDAGHPVQLFCPEGHGVSHLFEPGKGETLDWMARLEPEGGTGLGALAQFAAAEIFRRSTNVLIFPTEQRVIAQVQKAAGLLQEMATRVIAVAVSARSFEPGGAALSEEAEREMLSALAGMRVIVYVVEQGKDLGECLREPLPA